jgi:D-methionine transport system ATP-binding protein
MIELVQLTKTYASKIKVLQDISLTVPCGQIFGVIGPSGAGKSTLIRCINLLERPTSGKVILANQDLTSLSQAALRQARKKIGMIFQHFNLLSSRTVYQNIALPLEISNYSKQEIAAAVKPLLELTGLEDKQDFYPSHLSGGQKQRVAIARALVTQPKVLLSDEATSALDPHTTHSILQLLKEINERLGVTILLITHEMEVVKEICHQLAIIEHGKIIEQADVLEFFSNPKTNTAKQFIRSNLKHKLPESIQQHVTKEKIANSDILLRLSFVGSAAQEPLIAFIVKNFNIEINILQANIEVIREQIVGVMLIQATHKEVELQQAISYLQSKNVFVEVIGFYGK